MKTKKQTVTESEFQLEVAKVAKKYSQEGYRIYYNYRRKGFVFDLYALNQETGDRVIFEFKHYGNKNKRSSSEIASQIGQYKTTFPECKVVIVFVRDLPKIQFEPGFLKELLRRLISKKYEDVFLDKIKTFQSFENVTDLDLDLLDFSLEGSVRLKGSGNISFRSSANTVNMEGTLVNDGITFFFQIEPFFLYPFVYDPYYLNNQRNIVSFDFSEFTDGENE